MTYDAFKPPTKTIIVPQNDAGGLMLSDMLTIDCTTLEAPSDDAMPTRLPVEDSADVTDHVVVQPTRLALGVVQTNHPAELFSVATVPQRSRHFYEDLFRFQQTKQLLTIVTPHRVYENMILTSVPPSWDASNGEGFVGTLQFEEIVRVATKIVAIERPKNPSGQKLQKQGTKTMKQAENESWLHSAKSAAVGN